MKRAAPGEVAPRSCTSCVWSLRWQLLAHDASSFVARDGRTRQPSSRAAVLPGRETAPCCHDGPIISGPTLARTEEPAFPAEVLITGVEWPGWRPRPPRPVRPLQFSGLSRLRRGDPYTTPGHRSRRRPPRRGCGLHGASTSPGDQDDDNWDDHVQAGRGTINVLRASGRRRQRVVFMSTGRRCAAGWDTPALLPRARGDRRCPM